MIHLSMGGGQHFRSDPPACLFALVSYLKKRYCPSTELHKNKHYESIKLNITLSDGVFGLNYSLLEESVQIRIRLYKNLNTPKTKMIFSSHFQFEAFYN